jgi:MoaA/NifB/PqqE/SkfB family radical SAM enzyme
MPLSGDEENEVDLDCDSGECLQPGDVVGKAEAKRREEDRAGEAERVHRDAFEEPKCFDILLNYACQAKCQFCSQDFDWRQEKNLMPFRQACEKIYLAYQQGYRRLGFTGGEPTLRKDLPKLIAFAKKTGFSYVRIQTNGIRTADYAYTKELVDAGLTFVKFSIHGHDAKTHDELTMIPGSFQACLDSIDHLKRLRVGMGVNIVLNKVNYAHLDEFFDLFLLKLHLSNFVIIAPLYEGNMNNYIREMGVRLTAVAPHVRKSYEKFTAIDFPKPPLLLHFVPCVLPGYEQQMLGWSAFNTTVVSPQGKLRDLDETVLEHTIKTAACGECVYNDRCIGFDKSYSSIFGTDEIAPLKEVPKRYDADKPAADPRARTVLTDNEQCAIFVLREKSGVTTDEFLGIADRFPICKDCKDENAVINAAETLIKMGRIRREFKKGKYLWYLVEENDALEGEPAEAAKHV